MTTNQPTTDNVITAVLGRPRRTVLAFPPLPRTVKAEPLIVDVGPISQGGWRVSIYQGSSGDRWVHVADFSDEADAVEAAEVLASQLPQATLQRTEDAW